MTYPILRVDRARAIIKQSVARGDDTVQWRELAPGGRKTWEMKVEPLWTAFMHSPNSDPQVLEVTHPLQCKVPFTFDLWLDRVNAKVLSVRMSPGGELKLISMRPGPWEAWFGLMEQSWNRSDPLRLREDAFDYRQARAQS